MTIIKKIIKYLLPYGVVNNFKAKKLLSYNSYDEFLKLLKKNKRLDICCTKFVYHYALQLQQILTKHSYRSFVLLENNSISYSDDVCYIIMSPMGFNLLPKHFISYNFEQLESSKWLTSEYKERLNNSALIMDYSLNNTNYLRKIFPNKTIIYMPIILKPVALNYKKSIDILFYGTINKRRKKILDKLKRKFKITIISNIYGMNMSKIINDSKIVLNIHFYNNAILEKPRLIECLSRNCIIISENSYDKTETSLFKNVEYVNFKTKSNLYKKINTYLKNDDLRANIINGNHQILLKEYKKFVIDFLKLLKII